MKETNLERNKGVKGYEGKKENRRKEFKNEGRKDGKKTWMDRWTMDG